MRRPVAQVGGGDSVQDWFNSIPLVTKVFLFSTLLSGALLTFKFISAESLILIWPKVVDKFEIWRIFTCLIYAGPFSFNFAMHTYVLYENCKRYEANPFNTGGGGSTADFLWMIIVTMGFLLTIAYSFDMFILSEPILYVIMYVWSRKDPASDLNIFGFKFKSLYLPWVYIAIRLIMGGSITEPLIGIGVGHLYYFLIEILPHSPNFHLGTIIRTPQFCIDISNYFSTGANNTPAYNVYAPNAAAANTNNNVNANRGTGYAWGRGRALGAN